MSATLAGVVPAPRCDRSPQRVRPTALRRPTKSVQCCNSVRAPLRVALVAPTLRILGGHAVQADRLLTCWAGDSQVRAFLSDQSRTAVAIRRAHSR